MNFIKNLKWYLAIPILSVLWIGYWSYMYMWVILSPDRLRSKRKWKKMEQVFLQDIQLQVRGEREQR
jgi:hypothetical protein